MTMRALEPDVQGFISRDGVSVAYESYGSGERTVLFPPVDVVAHSRVWKAQIPYLARHARVVSIDPRGNGRSDRPLDPSAYTDEELVADTLQVMDELGIAKALLIGLCGSGWQACLVAAQAPERVVGIVTLAANVPELAPMHPWRAEFDRIGPLDVESHQGWAKDNVAYWWQGPEAYRDYLEFFASQIIPEPHRSKLYEDFVEWGLESSVGVREAERLSPSAYGSPEQAIDVLRRVRCPVLAIYGEQDRCTPNDKSLRLAEHLDARLVEVTGGGHLLMGTEPVLVNTEIRAFLDQVWPVPAPARRRQRAMDRPKKVLYLSSAIGLGHAARDVAIVGELRKLVPGVQVDWLTQHPVTEVLARKGERIHPASAWLASESAHVESMAGEHRLDVFHAIRQMDEMLIANYMVFDDLVRDEPYDLWVGDEAWDLDYFLHENPERKRAPYVWMTDFVGWLPMPERGEREAFLTADYNAEMIEQIARFPRLRDRSVFVGNPADCVDLPLGPGLPTVREWTEQHFEFSGHVLGARPYAEADRPALRQRLGYGPRDRVCVVTVGGSAVGTAMLRRLVEAWPMAKRAVPELRMVLVTGPRIDPASLPRPTDPDLTVCGYLPDLTDHLAACDLAVVQGGLTTTMDLVAGGRPFLYLPLQGHFEQNLHVPQRLAQYGAGVRVDWSDATAENLADLIKASIGLEVSYQPVETDGAVRAATMLAEML
jgi:pimeloyl-ACP methyl ester carboxylesterase/predicted glycosyltransferase